MANEYNWLALAIGNSRLHWAWFRRETLIETWDSPHLINTIKPNQLPQLFLYSSLIEKGLTNLPVYLASVVSSQTQLWQNYRELTLISLKDIELTNTYPSMGVDRALAAWGAIATYNQSCLVIDGGTALTFTGVDKQGKLIGGAILPGLRSQLTILKQKTAALPEIQLPDILPTRWALDTDQAIASGIIYMAIAGIHNYITDWLEQFPNSQVIFTGGDGELLSRYLDQQFPHIADQTILNQNLVFQGIKLVYEQQKNP
ncbi:MAG: pantothenate kinase [Waterburya sp.]